MKLKITAARLRAAGLTPQSHPAAFALVEPPPAPPPKPKPLRPGDDGYRPISHLHAKKHWQAVRLRQAQEALNRQEEADEAAAARGERHSTATPPPTRPVRPPVWAYGETRRDASPPRA